MTIAVDLGRKATNKQTSFVRLVVVVFHDFVHHLII